MQEVSKTRRGKKETWVGGGDVVGVSACVCTFVWGITGMGQTGGGDDIAYFLSLYYS